MASLFKRVKEKKSAALKENTNCHAIVSLGANRVVRDAYFHGLVFAAVANDDKIDDAEQKRLIALGESLEFTSDDIQKTIQSLVRMDDDTKMTTAEECVRQFTNVDVAEIFLKEFEEIWTLGGGNKSEFEEVKTQLMDWMGDEVRQVLVERAKAAAEAERKRLAEAEEKRRKAEEEKKNRQYNTLRAVAHKYSVKFAVKNKEQEHYSYDHFKFSIEEIREDFISASLAGLDVQDMFKQIASHFVLDMENLNDKEQAVLARDTAWMLIALSTERLSLDEFTHSLSFRVKTALSRGNSNLQTVFSRGSSSYYMAQGVLSNIYDFPNNLRKGKSRKEENRFRLTLGTIGFDSYSDPLSFLSSESISERVALAWYGCAHPTLSEEIESSTLESWFCETAGAKPVYMDLFSLTPEQVTKLNEWRSLRKGYSKERLADYAHSIGINQAFGWDVIEHLLDKKKDDDKKKGKKS